MSGEALHLRKGNAYYFHVQCRLFVCGHNYGDVVVLSQRSYHWECIYRDDVLWEEMLPKAQHFVQIGLLPELLE